MAPTALGLNLIIRKSTSIKLKTGKISSGGSYHNGQNENLTIQVPIIDASH